MSELTKTTPIDVSEFEREQLRFFLSGSDLASTLAQINPSLAWLPVLAEMNLLENEAALPLWMEQNFSSLDAVREVVKNIHLFKAESAAILDHRLRAQQEKLEPLLEQCWKLIIRHIRNGARGALQNEWFQILPHVRKGDLSADVIERLTNMLTPRLFVEDRFAWHDPTDRQIEKPTDVLSIKYRVGEGVSEDELLKAWPKTTPAGVEEQLVRTLTNSLTHLLIDATDVGVEGSVGLGITDIDVPSVAAHEQNAYHAGLLPIVRVIAELWSRLLQKDAGAAHDILREWERSDFRLMHRLALYGAADPTISPAEAANILTRLPQGELFLTNSQVEVHRLIRERWSEFPLKERQLIEARIVEGPPTDWFREGADLSRAADAPRFELLLDLERSKIALGKQAAALLKQLRKRHPKWSDTEPQRVGFTIWQGSVSGTAGPKEKLSSVPSARLIQAAKKAADEAHYSEGDSWQGLCQAEPITAFVGIESAPPSDRWHEWAWRPLLWAATKIPDPAELNRIGSLLAKWPKTAPFGDTASGAAFWMDQVSEKLSAPILWAVWDLVERRSPRRETVLNKDFFGTALNDPAGNLASVLLKRTPRIKRKVELTKQLRTRYEKLIGGGGFFALLARVRLSAAVAYLFQQAPQWTTDHLLPSYHWNSPDALAMWSARKYSNHIGTPDLFRRIKKPFLELFSRPEVPEEDSRVFSDWLAAILLANQTERTRYPLTTTEVRTVLRRAGPNSLSSFAQRLATRMRGAQPGKEAQVWNDIVGPVFQRTWPLDIELQTSAATFRLVQILLSTGAAFEEAAKVIIPFIRSENQRQHSSIHAISEAADDLYGIAPDQMLNLLSAVAGNAPERSLYGITKALEKLKAKAPHLTQTKMFQRLVTQATPY